MSDANPGHDPTQEPLDPRATEVAKSRGDAIITELRVNLQQGVSDPAIEAELANYIKILLPVSSPEHITRQLTEEQTQTFFERAEIGVQALVADKPNLILAKKIRHDLSSEINLKKYRLLGPLINFIASRPLHATLFGMFLSSLPIIAYMYLVHSKDWWPVGWSTDLFWVIFFANIGAMTSIASRVQENANNYDNDPVLYFAMGMLKPYVGIAIAIFAASVLKSRLLSVAGIFDADIDPDVVAHVTRSCAAFGDGIGVFRQGIAQLGGAIDAGELANVEHLLQACENDGISKKNFYAAVIVGFLGGYSERFAKDMIGRAESTLTSGKDENNGSK